MLVPHNHTCMPAHAQKIDPRSHQTSFACLEIHVVPHWGEEEEEDPTVQLYRVFSHYGVLEKKDAMVGGSS